MGGRELVFAAGAALLLGSLLFAPQYEAVVDAYGYGLRVTARITLAFFGLAYIARPLVQLFGFGQWLVRQRRYLGIMAAVSHTVHFVYVVLYLDVSNEPLVLVTGVFGGLGFVFFWLMALTSNNASMRALGVWWRRLHKTGMHYIWGIFFVTYLFSAWGTAAVVAIAALRLAAFVVVRRRRTATPT